MIPFHDPTLLFTNAGMNQFKDVFTGQRKVPYSRAATTQKCIRAGGKHNDLDNVGFTSRHLTFFEMLGNFSFGDYFKEEAIAYAWEWVTKDLGLARDRLYASVYEDDDESFELWCKVAPELKNGRVMRFGKKDNWWAMGDTGPNGPNSEIHYDRGEKYGTGPQDVVNGETERFVEIWNLVFMQYETRPDGDTVPLPKPSVDTGAGLERLASVMQGVSDVFNIDIFQTIIKSISDLTGSRYEDNISSHHVVADHIRALSFAIADGAGISNEGQGYVLRRILRRASRNGRLLGMHEPFIYKLVPILITEMGNVFPELSEKQDHIEKIIKAEEEAFGRTLDTGCDLFENISERAKRSGQKVVEGDDVFRLYDTYGFPYDLTEVMAHERGLSLDREGFEKAMEQQRRQSKAGARFDTVRETELNELIADLQKQELESTPLTDFVRESLVIPAQIEMVSCLHEPNVAAVLNRTPFYVEAGGQIGDTGKIYNDAFTVEVTSVYNHQDHIIHFGRLTKGSARDLKVGTDVTAEVETSRRWDIMRNHTATHLCHKALRTVLGEHVKQSGSYVGPDRLRFDFSHHQPMTEDEIARVEEIVNTEILKATPVSTETMDIELARKSGAMALFGEKYDEKVRVVSVGDFSKELCGGTHVQNVSQIGPFFITLETGIAAGVRRLEAITGLEAIKYMLEAKKFRTRIASILNRQESDALEGVRQLQQQKLEAEKEIKKIKAEMFSGKSRDIGDRDQKGPIAIYYYDFDDTDSDTVGAWIDKNRDRNEPAVSFALGDVNNKKIYMASASGSAVRDYGIDIGKITRQILPQYSGRGGGKVNFAQGSVAPGTMIMDLKNTAKDYLPNDEEDEPVSG